MVSAALHIGHPLWVSKVPFGGFADAGVKGLGRLPAEFRFELARINRIAAVMAASITTYHFEQVESSHDVGLNELAGAMDGPVHMAFGREVDHLKRPMLGKQAADQNAVTDVTLHQLVA